MTRQIVPDTPSEIARRYVEETCRHPRDLHYKDHLFRTAFWVKALRPDADETLLTAAFLHDIERIIQKPGPTPLKRAPIDFMDPHYLAWHQEKSAEVASVLLRENHVDETFIERVASLIRRHEIGGNEDQDLLKDADSLSFFETGVEHFLEVWVPIAGQNAVRKKFVWMFERISSPMAKKICAPLSRAALKRLDALGVPLFKK